MRRKVTKITFIIGGAGSGKTGEIISRLSQLNQGGGFSDALLLTPSVRHGDQLRRRLVARCGVAMGLRVERLSQFSQGLAANQSSFENDRRQRVADSSVASVAEELLLRVTRREIEIGEASYFGPIQHTKGLGRLVRAAVFNLGSEGVDPEHFRQAAQASGMQHLQALAAIYCAYANDLDRRNWIHPSATPFIAARAVKNGAPLPNVVLLDGLQVFRGGELALLKEVGERTPLIVSMDPNAGERAEYDFNRILQIFPQSEVVNVENSDDATSHVVQGGESADQESQIRDIASLIKRRLVEEPDLRPSDFAVAFRQFGPHLPLARQVFAEYKLPLDPSAGESLSNQPLGAWLCRLLHLSLDGWRLTDLAAVLDSGFMNLGRWNLTIEDVRAFMRTARFHKHWRGHQALLEAAAVFEGRQSGHGINRALEDLHNFLETTALSLGNWAHRWDDALFGDIPLINPECTYRPEVSAGVESLRNQLAELIRVERALGGGAASLESFAAWMESRMEVPGILVREAGGVFLAPMRALGGLRFNSVFVGGLVEGEFPAPRIITSLLNESALNALAKAGLELPPDPSLSEHDLWLSASSRADETLYLWKTRIDSRGRPASASYFYNPPNPNPVNASQTSPCSASSLRELAIACTADWRSGGRLRPKSNQSWPIVRKSVRVEQLRRSYKNAGVHEGLVSPGMVQHLTGPEAVWSASRLESFRTCSFQFFGRYGLRLRELDEEVDASDAAIRGSVIHEILEQVLAPLKENKLPLNPDTLDGVLERLRNEGSAIWNQAPAGYGFSPTFTWTFAWQDTLDKLERMLVREATLSRELGVERVLGIEMILKGRLPLEPPMNMTAAIDRLDEGPKGLIVVDYKSGRDIPRKRVLEGDRLQLQLYAL